MKIEFTAYLLWDNHGNKLGLVVNDNNDIVCVPGLRDDEGNLLHFESEAYHLKNWVKENKLNIAEKNAHIDFFE